MSQRRYQKALYLAYFLVALLLLVTIGLSIMLSLAKSTINEKKFCTSKSCIKAANTILENLDTEADPCENFYQFTCGNFVKSKRIPDEQSRLDVFDHLRDTLAYNIADLLAEPIQPNDIESIQKAKDLFKSCMDEESTQRSGDSRILSIIKTELYGWPILTESFNFNTVSILDKLVRLRMHDVRGFFDLHVGTNPKDPSSLILRLRQPQWFFNKELYANSSVTSAYKSYMLRTAQLLNSSSKNLRQEIERMFELEKDFAMIQIEENLRRNAVYKNMTLRDLQKRLPEFDWRKYVLGLFNQVENVTVYDNETILVDDVEYLEKALRIYTNVIRNNRRDFDNLLLWTFIKDKALFMSKKFKESRMEFDKVLTGIVSTPPRSLTCSNFVLDTMEYAVGRMYVSNYFNNQSKAAATEMILNIQKEFKNLIAEQDWMDNESKKHALEKLALIDTKIGYPDFTYNDTYVDEIYYDYTFTNFDFLENFINIIKADTLQPLKEFRKKRELNLWQRGPAMVNAFYSPSNNQICFPAGILQSPFYDASVPNYLNYGGIGSVIGHEITHGFDDRGRLYDKNGIFHSDESEGIWTQKTIENYKKKVECMIDQYNNYTSSQVNRSLNGFRTQGENIADNGGIKQAYRAYKKWAAKYGPEPMLPGLGYTQEQLFFINFGQVWCGKFRNQSLVSRILNGDHSPGEFRVIGSTSNFAEFGDVFKCKRGSKNNPVKKCSVW